MIENFVFPLQQVQEKGISWLAAVLYPSLHFRQFFAVSGPNGMLCLMGKHPYSCEAEIWPFLANVPENLYHRHVCKPCQSSSQIHPVTCDKIECCQDYCVSWTLHTESQVGSWTCTRVCFLTLGCASAGQDHRRPCRLSYIQHATHCMFHRSVISESPC